MAEDIIQSLNLILSSYKSSFEGKIYVDENNETDLLMDIFGLTPEIKRENRQYWGRELGMCWQKIVVEICKSSHKEFLPPPHIGLDEPCDLIVGNYAIDTKYRIGSGDSGTLKKLRTYGNLLSNQAYKPYLLIVRSDNLPAAITACKSGGWRVLTEETTYSFLEQLTNFEIRTYLQAKALEHKVLR